MLFYDLSMFNLRCVFSRILGYYILSSQWLNFFLYSNTWDTNIMIIFYYGTTFIHWGSIFTSEVSEEGSTKSKVGGRNGHLDHLFCLC